MIALAYKAKNYASFALKVGILSISFYYLYTKLVDQELYLDSWWIKMNHPLHLLSLFGFFLMSLANWWLESKKWQLLVSSYRAISFWQAFEQTLVSLTVSIATPNRLGEYAAKAYFFPKKAYKQILFLNGIGNMTQMAVTCIFGVLGLLLWNRELYLQLDSRLLVGFFLGCIVLVLVMYLLPKKTPMLQSFNLTRLKIHLRRISIATRVKVLGLSLGRYVIFGTQFYLILLFLGVEANPWTLLPCIFVMYLITSFLPMMPFLDVVVKGSLAVWVFQAVPISEFSVLAATLGIWVFNLVIPSILGSFQLIKAPN